MRVALVISNLEFGGAQRQLVELVNASRDMDVRYELVTLSNVIPLAGQLHDTTRLTVIQKRGRFDFSVVPRLGRFIREYRIDIVHGFLFDAEIAARLAGRWGRAKAIVGSERNVDYKIKRIQRIAYRLSHRTRDACIANSQAGADFNARQLGYRRDHYSVVYNGVDTSRFRPVEKAVACERLGLDPSLSWIGMVGSFKRQKNHTVFLRAARRLVDSKPDVRVLLVGDTLAEGLHGSNEYKREIMAEIERLEFGDNLVMLGNREDIENVYPACDLSVIPSLHEGTPNVALESMACGTPVVASDVSDNRYVIPDGVAGFVVPLNDVDEMAFAIERSLVPDTLAQLRAGARQWVEAEFSTQAFARNMLEVYRGLLSP